MTEKTLNTILEVHEQKSIAPALGFRFFEKEIPNKVNNFYKGRYNFKLYAKTNSFTTFKKCELIQDSDYKKITFGRIGGTLIRSIYTRDGRIYINSFVTQPNCGLDKDYDKRIPEIIPIVKKYFESNYFGKE